MEDREAHHALHVLRLTIGEKITVLDGAGSVFLCEVESVTKKSVELAIKEKTHVPPPDCQISLLVGIPKGKIIEDIIQKAVELGSSSVIPILTERVVAQLDPADAIAKREKWQQVAIEAIKQCGAAWLPKVEIPQTIQNCLDRIPMAELSVVGSLQTVRRHPREWISEFRRDHGCPPRTASVWIGPEGDFTLRELQLIEGAGAKPITLGNLVLRVETAAIYCLSFLNYELRGP